MAFVVLLQEAPRIQDMVGGCSCISIQENFAKACLKTRMFERLGCVWLVVGLCFEKSLKKAIVGYKL
jgi:hypothetical protein